MPNEPNKYPDSAIRHLFPCQAGLNEIRYEKQQALSSGQSAGGEGGGGVGASKCSGGKEVVHSHQDAPQESTQLQEGTRWSKCKRWFSSSAEHPCRIRQDKNGREMKKSERRE